jgi:hypothetical protein
MYLIHKGDVSVISEVEWADSIPIGRSDSLAVDHRLIERQFNHPTQYFNEPDPAGERAKACSAKPPVNRHYAGRFQNMQSLGVFRILRHKSKY